MNGTRHPVKLQETDTEFLLYTHFSHRDRAKAIDGRRWDTERHCWVYPKTARVYDAIIAEFGDDMAACSIQRPSPPSSQAPAPSLKEENEELKSELGKIHKTLELITQGISNGSKSEIEVLQGALADRQKELADLRSKLLERDRAAESFKRSAVRGQEEVNRLRAANVALQTEPAKQQQVQQPGPTLEQIAKDAAKEATGHDGKYAALIDRVRLNEAMPNELVKSLERELRRILAVDDRGLSLHDLITMARDSELLTEKGIDLAHTIRRHRNILTHENTDKRTHLARAVLCMFAAALLWPELSE